MAPYEGFAKRTADDDRILFARRLLDHADDIITFVDERLGWDGEAGYDGILGGSFNISIKLVRGNTDECVIIRFPADSKVHAAWREEKVRNEVYVMQYLDQHTSIPVPRVRDWGLTADSPRQLGPFIIMDFVSGENLGQFLAPPTDDAGKLVFLDPDIDDAKLDIIYNQLARFMLELSNCTFSNIGALTRESESEDWTVTQRPLTYDMNEVVTVGGCPAGFFGGVNGPFSRASDYFAMCAQYFKLHLKEQRNIAGKDEEVAWKQYVARHCYEKLIPLYANVDDQGPFRLFCDDLRPTNMLIDPETLRITAVFDFEFTNVMPAQYSQDVPWWLLLQNPCEWLRDNEMDEFLRQFEPRKDQFIRAVERAEKACLQRDSNPAGESRLSARMRESWDSGRFWFNLATRCSFDVDDVYWYALHKEERGEAMLTREELTKKDEFIQHKMRQVDEYIKEMESDERFS